MRLARIFVLSLFAVLLALPAVAQKAPSADEASIRGVLTKQADDWNRGDLDAFAKGYKNSPDILFIGSTVRRGYDGMIASYKKNYPDKAAMGVLSFTNVEVHPLDARFATVLGNFHLERSAAGGGNADGFYSLVLEKTAAGWKIVLDHTTAAGH
jgi:ketosteroid isomerase-like protein